jgi:predicted transcriptional regulator
MKALPLKKDDSTSETNPYKLTWRDFNSTFLSNIEPLTDEQKKACLKNQDMVINLKPFMIETPYTVRQSVKFQQVVELFRNMNLRHLPVINDESNTLVGIITR